MSLGVLVSYHHAGAESLVQLRLLVDSLRQHTPYDHLLIVDDCSPHALDWIVYQEHLRNDPRVTVYRLGPPRIPFYHQGGKGGGPGETSFGHAVGIMAGFAKLRELGCTHAWVIDADCTVLDGGWLDEALRLFDHPRVAVVTDYFGGRPRAGFDQFVDEFNEVALPSLAPPAAVVTPSWAAFESEPPPESAPMDRRPLFSWTAPAPEPVVTPSAPQSAPPPPLAAPEPRSCLRAGHLWRPMGRGRWRCAECEFVQMVRR